MAGGVNDASSWPPLLTLVKLAWVGEERLGVGGGLLSVLRPLGRRLRDILRGAWEAVRREEMPGCAECGATPSMPSSKEPRMIVSAAIATFSGRVARLEADGVPCS